MPKHHGRPAAEQNSASRNRLTKRLEQPENPKRMALLAELLEESSSASLNDLSSQQSARQTLENHSKLFDLIDELRLVERDINLKLPVRNEVNWTKFFEWIDVHSSVPENSQKDGQKLLLSDRIGVAKQTDIVRKQCNHDQARSEESPADNEQQSQQDDNNNEYSLIAKVPIKQGERVFSISRNVMLTTETAAKDLDLLDFIRRDSIASGMHNVVLVLHLLNEYSKQDRSYWWPYLSILPNKLLPILELNKQKLALLSASAFIFEALKLLRAIVRQYSYFYKCLQATKLPLRKVFTFELYAWGVSIVCSRQNEIPSQNRQPARSLPHVHALIPVLDMCNHDRISNQATFELDQSQLIASKALEPLDEITINYGQRSSGEFYIHNGFVPPASSPSAGLTFDFVPFALALNRSRDEAFDKKTRLLKTLNMPNFGHFKLILNDHAFRHKRDPHLAMFLIVYFMNEHELDLILSSDNPVGIADEIYTSIQYPDRQDEKLGPEGGGGGGDANKEVEQMKHRLSECIRSYSSKRASICVTLIDRTLESSQLSQDDPIGHLLARERAIYESYM